MSDFSVESDAPVALIARMLVEQFIGNALKIATECADDYLVTGNYERATMWSEVVLAVGDLIRRRTAN